MRVEITSRITFSNRLSRRRVIVMRSTKLPRRYPQLFSRSDFDFVVFTPRAIDAQILIDFEHSFLLCLQKGSNLSENLHKNYPTLAPLLLHFILSRTFFSKLCFYFSSSTTRKTTTGDANECNHFIVWGQNKLGTTRRRWENEGKMNTESWIRANIGGWRE